MMWLCIVLASIPAHVLASVSATFGRAEGVPVSLRDASIDTAAASNTRPPSTVAPTVAEAISGAGTTATQRHNPCPADKRPCPKISRDDLCGSGRLPTDFGEKCDFDINTMVRYEPDPCFMYCLGQQHPVAPGVVRVRREMREALAEIDRLQNPPDGCRNGGRQWYLGKAPEFGQGSSVMHVANMLLGYWSQDNPVVIGHSPWRYTDGACGNGWSCFLSPISRNCTIDTLWHERPQQVLAPNPQKMGAFPTLEQVCHTKDPGGKYDEKLGRCLCTVDKGFAPGHGDCVPMAEIGEDEAHSYRLNQNVSLHGGEWAYYAPGTFLPMPHYGGGTRPSRVVRSTLLTSDQRRLGRPTVMLKLIMGSPKRKVLDAFVDSLGLNPKTRKLPCIALHVRHGDACNSDYKINNVLERTCFPLKHFVKQIRRLIKRYGPHIVYLATDDSKIIAESKHFPDISWRYQHMSRTKYETLRVSDDNPALATASAAEEVWKDLYAMGQCDMAVGSMVSTILQLAMEVQIARKGHFVPFVSVETPWGDPFLWQGWYHFTKDGDMFGKTGCTCKRLEPPKGYPRHCKCDNSNGYS